MFEYLIVAVAGMASGALVTYAYCRTGQRADLQLRFERGYSEGYAVGKKHGFDDGMFKATAHEFIDRLPYAKRRENSTEVRR